MAGGRFEGWSTFACGSDCQMKRIKFLLLWAGLLSRLNPNVAVIEIIEWLWVFFCLLTIDMTSLKVGETWER